MYYPVVGLDYNPTGKVSDEPILSVELAHRLATLMLASAQSGAFKNRILAAANSGESIGRRIGKGDQPFAAEIWVKILQGEHDLAQRDQLAATIVYGVLEVWHGGRDQKESLRNYLKSDEGRKLEHQAWYLQRLQ